MYTVQVAILYIRICFTVHVYTGPTGVVESLPSLLDTHTGEDDCWCWNISLATEEFGPPQTAYKNGRLRKSVSTDSFERLS